MLKWEYLNEILYDKMKYWANSGPTRHVLIDNFLDTETCRKLYNLQGVEKKLAAVLPRTHKHVRGKSGTPRPSEMTDLQAKFFTEINSPMFVSYLEQLTGISPLYADPDLNGGGVHVTRPGGYLNVHLDFNGHPSNGTNRRLNLLLYLNEDWKDDWNGHIELWDTGLQRPFLKAAPIMNRVLVFETSEESYHGHPLPLKAPPGTYRFSLAVYYYADWPEGLVPRPQTYYQLVRSQWADVFSRIGKQMKAGTTDVDGVVKAIEVDYQTNDIRRAYIELVGLEKKMPLGYTPWGEMMTGMAGMLAEKPVSSGEMADAMAGEYQPEAVELAYSVLTSIRSAKLTGENYWEYPDGRCTIEPPPGKKR